MPDAITDAELAEWERLSSEATAGPWFFNGYSAIFSGPLSDEYDRVEREIEAKHGDNPPTEAFAALPETQCAYVPVVGGDTGTAQGMKDAAFIAAVREALPRLIAAERERRREAAPIVKVTECVGEFVRFVEGDYIDADPDMGLRETMPAEAIAPTTTQRRDEARGPRGRFRITVEFWPEDDAP